MSKIFKFSAIPIYAIPVYKSVKENYESVDSWLSIPERAVLKPATGMDVCCHPLFALSNS